MGQINIDTKFGKYLYDLAANDQYKVFVEVGTWNGQGSTRCLISGIVGFNPNAKLYSLEANANMFNQAKSFWSNCPRQLHLIHGVLHKKQLMLDEIEKHPMYYKLLENGDKYKTWLLNDIQDMQQINIFNIEEDNVDVIVLDGGEFSTHGDWEVLQKKNPKIVCLDDSNVLKTYDIRNELLHSKDWEVVVDEQADRNGWCVFKRR